MRWQRLAVSLLLVVSAIAAGAAAWAQANAPLSNDDVVAMVKQGLNQGVILKSIETSDNNFDVSPSALGALQNAGVNQTVVEAMLNAHQRKINPAASVASGAAAENNTGKYLLKEGSDVPLVFVSDLTSKTANEGDPVEMTLAEDLKVGDVVVAKKGARAVAIVSNARKAGMVGKAGELNITLQHLVVGETRVKVRGTKGREGDSKTGTAVALTVLFGPIGLIKHGKNVEVKAGTPLAAFVDTEAWLPPAS